MQPLQNQLLPQCLDTHPRAPLLLPPGLGFLGPSQVINLPLNPQGLSLPQLYGQYLTPWLPGIISL